MTTYYVSPTGSDSNPGTLASPWQTLSKVSTSLVANDTAIFLNGTYVAETTFTTASITLQAQNKWGAKLIESGADSGIGTRLLVIKGDHTTIDGFEMTGPDMQLGVSIECNFGTVQNCWVHDVCNFDIGSAGGAGIRAARHANTDYVGSGCAIFNNRVERCGPLSGGVVVGNSFIHCLYVQTNNTLAQGQVYNNLLIEGAGGGIVMFHNPNNWLVTNNTIINCKHTGITCWGDTAAGFLADTNTVQNNLIVECGASVSYQAIWSQSDNCGASNVFRKNLAYFPGQTPIYDNTTATVNPPQDMSQNLANANPLFVNYVNDGSGNYHLTSSSPAINTASATGAPSTDYDGHTRPYLSGYDVGAYEFSQPTFSMIQIGL